MKFIENNLPGSYLIELESFQDHRGSFTRTFCAQEFEKMGLNTRMVQTNNSLSSKKGTLRGMHYQVNDFEECKLVKCIRGSIFDVIIDLRTDSPTFCKYFGIELTEDNQRMLYVPAGFAHGFITLQDNSEVCYQVSNFYSPENERGVRWNDPLFNIEWPIENPIVSERDSKHKNFTY